MISKKDKAMAVYEKLRNNKQSMNVWEHGKNQQFKAEMQKKMEGEAEQAHKAPDYVQDHINWLK